MRADEWTKDGSNWNYAHRDFTATVFHAKGQWLWMLYRGDASRALKHGTAASRGDAQDAVRLAIRDAKRA